MVSFLRPNCNTHTHDTTTQPTQPTQPTVCSCDVAPARVSCTLCRGTQEFEKLDRIGEGTYGVVYKARDLASEQIVALKRVKMKQEVGGLPISTLREISLLRKARDHVNVVSLYEVVVGRDLQSVFLVMEHCDQDLGELVDTLPIPFQEDQVKCLTLQLIRGVEWLHSLYIVHRDLKLSNLLLDSSGVLKIADFGLARTCGIDDAGLVAKPAKPLSPRVVTLWFVNQTNVTLTRPFCKWSQKIWI